MQSLLRSFCYFCLYVWLELFLKIGSPNVAQATSNSKCSCLGLLSAGITWASHCAWLWVGFSEQFCPEFLGMLHLSFSNYENSRKWKLEFPLSAFHSVCTTQKKKKKPLNKCSVRSWFCARHLVNSKDSVVNRTPATKGQRRVGLYHRITPPCVFNCKGR